MLSILRLTINSGVAMRLKIVKPTIISMVKAITVRMVFLVKRYDLSLLDFSSAGADLIILVREICTSFALTPPKTGF